METLKTQVPARICDPGGEPRFGAYRGVMANGSLNTLGAPFARRGLARIRSEKTWYYACITHPEWVAGLAIIQMGYASAAFTYLFDRQTRSFIVDQQSLAPPLVTGRVVARPGAGADAAFRLPGFRASILHPPGQGLYQVRIRLGGKEPLFDLAAELDAELAPAGMTAICPVAGSGSVNLTVKQVALPARGRILAGGRSLTFDADAWAVLDYTHGYLDHHTSWMWACAGGKTGRGKPVGLNLTAGFNDGLENTIWLGDDLLTVGQVHFQRGTAGPLAPWRIQTEDGSVDLTFTPEGLREDHTDLGPLSTHYVQPVGTFAGTVRSAKGRPNKIEALTGITEEHLSRW